MNVWSLDHLLVHVGYLLMLAGLITRDILWLRLILIVAQTCLGVYGLHIDNSAITFWNFVMVGMNVIRVVGLLAERRPIHLARDLEGIYRQVFLSMTRREFLLLWEMGEVRTSAGAQLVQEGTTQQELVLLLDGDAVVRKGAQELARLARGHFVAEMSFISGEPASADVIAANTVRYIAWPQEKLRALKQLNPGLLIKLQHILARDLTGKVKAASRKK